MSTLKKKIVAYFRSFMNILSQFLHDPPLKYKEKSLTRPKNVVIALYPPPKNTEIGLVPLKLLKMGKSSIEIRNPPSLDMFQIVKGQKYQMTA